MTAIARSGKKTGLRVTRSKAISNPSARMHGSAIRKILTLSRKPSTTSGHESRKCCGLRNARRNESQPLEVDRTTQTIASTTPVLISAIRIEVHNARCFQAGGGVSNACVCASVSSPGGCADSALIDLLLLPHTGAKCVYGDADRQSAYRYRIIDISARNSPRNP